LVASIDSPVMLMRRSLHASDAVAAFVMSNELWGGAGSIADQALGGRSAERLQLERLLIELGREQIAMGYANPRTEMWTSAFTEWHTQNI
jgi:hypothetical protein